MGRLVLRQEDKLSQLRADKSYILSFNTSRGILPSLFATSKKWKEIQETESKLDMSLRQTLILAVLYEWQARLEKTIADASLLKACQEPEWLATASPMAWSFQKWDAVAKEVTILKEAVPYPVDTFYRDVQRLKQLLVLPNVVHRFHATRPLAEQPVRGGCVPLDFESKARGSQGGHDYPGQDGRLFSGPRDRTGPHRQPLAEQLQKLLPTR